MLNFRALIVYVSKKATQRWDDKPLEEESIIFHRQPLTSSLRNEDVGMGIVHCWRIFIADWPVLGWAEKRLWERIIEFKEMLTIFCESNSQTAVLCDQP